MTKDKLFYLLLDITNKNKNIYIRMPCKNICLFIQHKQVFTFLQLKKNKECLHDQNHSF